VVRGCNHGRIGKRSGKGQFRELKNPKGKEERACVPKLAARAFAISAIRETLTVDRPIAIWSELVKTFESGYAIPFASEPQHMTWRGNDREMASRKATSAVTVSGLSILIMTRKKQTALEDIGSRS